MSAASGGLTVLATAEEVAARAAAVVAETIRGRPQTRLVLAGGTTPRRCYELLAEMDIPWGRVTILFGDERCLPPNDPETNYNLALNALLRKVLPGSVHRIPGELGPDEAARLYEPVVATGTLDLVLLGIGPDGHTASLFPGNPALGATTLVAPVRAAAKPPPERVTLTFRALRSAARTLLLATGTDKKDALAGARQGTLPAGMVGAEIVADRAAAGA